MTCGHGKLAGKTKRAFTTHHQVGDDVEWVGVLNEWVNVEPSHILNGILMLDALHKFFIGKHTVANILNTLDDFGVRLLECVAAVGIASVEHCAVGKHDTHRFHHLVAIGMCSATHTRSVVHHNTAHHCRIFRRRVGGECLAIRAQYLIYLMTHDTRLHSDHRSIVVHFIFFPIFTGHNHN